MAEKKSSEMRQRGKDHYASIETNTNKHRKDAKGGLDWQRFSRESQGEKETKKHFSYTFENTCFQGPLDLNLKHENMRTCGQMQSASALKDG